MPQKLTDAEFISAWQRLGSARAVALEYGMAERAIRKRRKNLTDRGIDLKTIPAPGYENLVPAEYRDDGWTHPRELRVDISDGIVVVASDAHYWPGRVSVAHKALIAVLKRLKPRTMILNGDVFDGASVSRHDPFGWSTAPDVRSELDACQERIAEIEAALPKGARRLWNVGNHDARFERTLAQKVPQFTGLKGLRLADHFPGWELQWSAFINAGSAHPVMVKHRYASGVHAGYNNAMKGGVTMVTGHTHSLEVKPWGDYRGRRWGIQTGTLLDLHGPQTEYAENSPSPHCAGFAVLTFKDGLLTPPELCEVINGKAWFRGEVVA